MSALSFSKALRNGSSALALSTIALIGAQPAFATDGIFGGGSTLASLAERALGDDYLPRTSSPSVLLLYAGVGSGSGLRGYITNDPQDLFLGTGSYPASNPPYLFPSLGFSSYPYPRIDFGASDSPLPSNFVTGYNTTSYSWSGGATTANGTVTFAVANFGAPIQLPLFEAPVAIAINAPASGTGVWTIHSQGTRSAAGGAIQLSTAQVCAIFSGLVKDWSSTANIPYLKNDGTTGVEAFDASNTPGTAVPYTSSTTPIDVVYRSDGSGTSFIFTNYLKAVCPLLDPTNAYGYTSIFSTSNLPNVNFSNLIGNINAVRGASATSNWIGASGSDAVAAAISNYTSASTWAGRIGYLSNDFVTPQNTASTAPNGASVQNDYLRLHQVYHPGDAGNLGSAQNFIAPTPTSADAAWGVLSTPASATFTDWNVYAQTFPATTYLPGSGTSVSITGLSKLPLAPATGAYSLVGTAYGFVYSCYGTGRDGVAADIRATDLTGYLTYHYTNSNAKTIISNNGFSPLPAAWVTAITNDYLGGASSSISDTVNGGNGCSGVTGGAQ
ncbi:substrate-binding domain-containing protein [Methylosinus sporium]|uniref:substrate-binding domain-containing protein n=1 Tax=Methylosinus sporium TaxID=428 RepID=UPI00383A1D1D